MNRYELTIPVYSTYKHDPADKITLSADVMDALYEKLADQEVEQGGILGWAEPFRLTHYYHDEQAIGEPNRYTPSGENIRKVVAQWLQEGVMFAGFIHSHPPRHTKLSWSDRLYARELLAENHWLPTVLMGIMAGRTLVFYRFDRDYLNV